MIDGKWEEKWGEEECLMRSLIEADAMDFDVGDGETFTLYDKLDQLLSLVFAAYDTTSTSMYVSFRAVL